jgi:Restriction endonuclease
VEAGGHAANPAKWWEGPLQPQEVHAFKGAIDSKAKHTLDLLIAMNGFTAGAVDDSRATPLIFMDGADLIPILEARITLTEVLLRKRRHAAETGSPMYPVAKMIG